MYLCYLDESGTPDLPGNTSHYVLAGIAIPIWHWRDCEREVGIIRKKYDLEDGEIHTAWMMRAYLEQDKIPGFHTMPRPKRRQHVEAYRQGELIRLQKMPSNKAYKQVRKNYKHTNAYIHLAFSEREALVHEIAKCISKWGFARLFAECIDKVNFPITRRGTSTVDEQALEQVVSRFESYLRITSAAQPHPMNGLLVHDNNETVSKKHTKLMKNFHVSGTLWTDVTHIVETPLFVNSELTSMVQIADLCGYALRRFLENKEDSLFNLIFERADRRDGRVVGVRHFSSPTCSCKICASRRC